MKMRIYIAGTGHDPRFATTMMADNLRAHGYEVVSRWHVPGVWKPGNDRTIADSVAIATRNYADLDKADVLLVVVPEKAHHLRGVHAECGYAIAKGKRIVVWSTTETLNTMVNPAKCAYMIDWQGVVSTLSLFQDELNR